MSEQRQNKILNRILAVLAIIGIFLIATLVIYFIELNKQLSCLDLSDIPAECQKTIGEWINE